ncbi:hypothetical protein [Acetobacter ghanensis]|uniref:GHMP kinase N-terminal domain-containing protein n=1 Tax=Acetobacter ghanensis TaxID=431306 RepID=A0ABX0KQ35_9PROT|nr:hypothetical protein [Acetobacter ghanensis]NHO40586.1 hypothetical protein [Acetobacter ghanensis]
MDDPHECFRATPVVLCRPGEPLVMAEADERLLAKSKVAAHTYLMGHILAPSFAFCAALSEADLLAHLPANSPLHDGLGSSALFVMGILY